ncbi:hypothetical protein Tco_0552223 [Tanacetum coccineum]
MLRSEIISLLQKETRTQAIRTLDIRFVDCTSSDSSIKVIIINDPAVFPLSDLLGDISGEDSTGEIVGWAVQWLTYVELLLDRMNVRRGCDVSMS